MGTSRNAAQCSRMRFATSIPDDGAYDAIARLPQSIEQLGFQRGLRLGITDVQQSSAADSATEDVGGTTYQHAHISGKSA